MGLLEIASGQSVWRGMDYYDDKKVLSWKCSCTVKKQTTENKT